MSARIKDHKKHFIGKIVIDENGCWLWSGRRCPQGYGYQSFRGKSFRAHRLSWTLFVGDIAPGLFVLHKCDTPPCVNPKHLFLGTQLDNVADRDAKGRGVRPDNRGERSGLAKMTDEIVRELRRIYIPYSYEFGSAALGRKFDISQSAVSLAVNKKRWKHIK
jgi:hypothetical protein